MQECSGSPLPGPCTATARTGHPSPAHRGPSPHAAGGTGSGPPPSQYRSRSRDRTSTRGWDDSCVGGERSSQRTRIEALPGGAGGETQPSRSTSPTGTVCAFRDAPPARGRMQQHCRQHYCSAAGCGRGADGLRRWELPPLPPGLLPARSKVGQLPPSCPPSSRTPRRRAGQALRAHLALLVPVGEELKAVSGDSQELGVVLVQQGNHLLQAVGQAHSHLGPFLVEQQVVQGGDGVEEDRLDWRAAGRQHGATSARAAASRLTSLPAEPTELPRAPTPTQRPSAGPGVRPPCRVAPGWPSEKGHPLLGAEQETEPHLHRRGSVRDCSPPPAPAEPLGLSQAKRLKVSHSRVSV